MIIFRTVLIGFLLAGMVMASDSGSPGQWLRVDWSNDFVFQTDQYYTNGLSLSYFSNRSFPALVDLIHLSTGTDDRSYHGVQLSQDIFTPVKHPEGGTSSTDRPFASYLILSTIKHSVNHTDKLIKSSSFDVGLMGKSSGGQWLQNGVHSILPTSSPVYGWENQLQNSLVLNYSLQFEKELFYRSMFSLSGNLSGQLGSLYTNAAVGLTLRVGMIDDYFKSLDFSSGSGWRGYAYSTISGKVVGYNAILQGSLFETNKNHYYPQTEPFVYQVNTGFKISYKTFKVDIGAKFLSPEIKNGSFHRWGYISFMFEL